MVVFTLLSLQCSSTKPLSDTEKEKLDPPLIRLLSGKNADDSCINKYIRPDGTQEYGVVVRSEHPEEIKALGIAVNSVFGDVIVVHASIEEIRKIVSLSSVRAVHAGTRKTIQHN